MVVAFVAGAAACLGSAAVAQVGSFGNSRQYDRPIATVAPYPRGMADDVRRPGFNGRLWVSRPVMGSMQQGPYPLGWEGQGPEAYGAFDNQFARVPVRIGHIVVGISPWEEFDQDGLKRFEAARNFWLQEQGYTGGVRTFVNDSIVWGPDGAMAAAAGAEAEHASAPGEVTPRATIQLPADMPRQRRRLRVDAGGAAGRGLFHPGGEVRVSWPMSAPAGVVARSTQEPASRVITSAK